MNRKCRICECTEVDGCALEGGCFWAEPDLCSLCSDVMNALIEYYHSAGTSARRRGEIPADDAMQRMLDEFSATMRAAKEDLPEAEPACQVIVVSEFEASTIINQLKANA